METRRSARLVIVDEDGRLLLFRYHDEHHAPFWATPGGELLPGESYLDAARRELREETGLNLQIGRLVEKGTPSMRSPVRHPRDGWRRIFWFTLPHSQPFDVTAGQKRRTPRSRTGSGGAQRK